jgi:Flp pilus assembly protein TadB
LAFGSSACGSQSYPVRHLTDLGARPGQTPASVNNVMNALRELLAPSEARGRPVPWWLLLVVAIGAGTALVGVYAGLAQVWIAVAAAALGAVLPTCLDERLRRRELVRRRQR